MARNVEVWPLAGIEPRPYQVEAHDRMIERGNQLLALTMGSGKTITAQAAIETLYRRGDVRNGLVFVPNSLKYQWLESLRMFGLPAQVIDGPKEQKIWQYKHSRRFRYNIINYEALLGDMDILLNFMPEPHFIIADETTYIKSMQAKRSRKLKALGKIVPIRYALTGQPIENRPEELFSIMEFVDKAVLGPFQTFDRTFILRDHFGRPTRYRNMDTLKRAMEPVMFRRSRKDIEQYLPQIIPMEEWIDLQGPVRALYEYIAEDTLRVIEQAIGAGSMSGWNILAAYGKTDDTTGGQAMGDVMSRLTCMRLLCDHPSLLMWSANEFDDPDSRRGSRYASWLKEEGYLDRLGTRADDAKINAAIEVIEQIVSEDPLNKVVVFSYFKPMLRMIGQRLKKIPHVFLTGDHTTEQRRASLRSFKGRTPVLLSSDAGQYGIDLPHANYLISYDLPWSAGAYAQRTARIDRTSSLFPHVTVMSLLTRATIEDRQFAMLGQKQQVAEAWIDGKHIDVKGGLTLTLESLRSFLEAA